MKNQYIRLSERGGRAGAAYRRSPLSPALSGGARLELGLLWMGGGFGLLLRGSISQQGRWNQPRHRVHRFILNVDERHELNQASVLSHRLTESDPGAHEIHRRFTGPRSWERNLSLREEVQELDQSLVLGVCQFEQSRPAPSVPFDDERRRRTPPAIVPGAEHSSLPGRSIRTVGGPSRDDRRVDFATIRLCGGRQAGNRTSRVRAHRARERGESRILDTGDLERTGPLAQTGTPPYGRRVEISPTSILAPVRAVLYALSASATLRPRRLPRSR